MSGPAIPPGKRVLYCIGAQKAGTTWLGDYVAAHPDCYLPVMKECHFFEVRSGAETYARNLEEAVDAGVFGAPFWVVDDGQLFWGNDRLDDLDAHLGGSL